jgi:hypothetical protein
MQSCARIASMVPTLGAENPCKQFLQNQAGGDYGFSVLQRYAQRLDLRAAVHCIAPKRERPDAGVDQQRA